MSIESQGELARRVPCPKCATPIVAGARKCKGCKRWLGPKPRSVSRVARSFTLVTATVVAVLAVLISSRDSPVGEAPPLTPVPGSSVALDTVAGEASPAAFEPDFETRMPEPLEVSSTPVHRWQARQLQLDVHPLDVVFSATGLSVYVSGDDASLREYSLHSGRLEHMASMPAQGDRIRLLHNRYVAVLRHVDAVYIPVMDTENWDRDPMLLWSGLNPADIVEMPDGKTAIAASSGGKRLSWWELGTGRRLGNIRLPHATERLYRLDSDGHTLVAAVGTLMRGGRSAGAWIDLFDPSEEPFGATRRSVAAGREPRRGAVVGGGSGLLFVDHRSNSVSLLDVADTSRMKSATVGSEPVAAFTMARDKYGVTLDSGSKTLTVIDLRKMERISSLMLDGEPRDGAMSTDGGTLIISLGGGAWPPRGAGAVVVEGDPPKIVATLDTGRGASRVAMSADGTRAVVANYADKSLTVIER